MFDDQEQQQQQDNDKLESLLSPIFPKATSLLFHTGNALTYFKLVRKTNMNITEEIIEYISTMLRTLRKNNNFKQFENETYVKIIPEDINHEGSSSNATGNSGSNTVDYEQLSREDLKISVLQEMKENYLESLLLSFPNYGAKLTIDEILPLWNVVESYMNNQKILSAGVCDFMLPLLLELCDHAKHKPYADQINLGVCCSIPDELNKYVKENDIQLLTHSDPMDIINDSDFQNSIKNYCHEYDALDWRPTWVARYNSIIANRGIIKTKGYFVYASRELPIKS
ncbi:unnamed protein product [Didymodactylos carnosus]|uniref:GCS light chain n=1 Tax=Didymodactylos carnosus TaxID=1234261 RepID=A0A813NIQ0_9BILA|nr:unnamed protein product [Didymodactylos carnosus]CAF1155261.1 unnamed protein product [Didymodactylos carnosus]CAF3518469.1 unnamed protein product [Didymodactylos carnosus]CAF3966175.1 unnamed protein product [Didymodactylos carnosus]